VNLRARYAGGEAEVVERLDRWKAGDPRKHLTGSGAARVTLGPQRNVLLFPLSFSLQNWEGIHTRQRSGLRCLAEARRRCLPLKGW
jgi:hypothetical protein